MCSTLAEPLVVPEEIVGNGYKKIIDINGIEFEKDGTIGIIMVHPSKDNSCADYDPKLALQAIREEIEGDKSIRLIFLTGQGDRRKLLREIFEIEPAKNGRRSGKRRKRKTRNKMTKARHYLTHSGSILPMLLQPR